MLPLLLALQGGHKHTVLNVVRRGRCIYLILHHPLCKSGVVGLVRVGDIRDIGFCRRSSAEAVAGRVPQPSPKSMASGSSGGKCGAIPPLVACWLCRFLSPLVGPGQADPQTEPCLSNTTAAQLTELGDVCHQEVGALGDDGFHPHCNQALDQLVSLLLHLLGQLDKVAVWLPVVLELPLETLSHDFLRGEEDPQAGGKTVRVSLGIAGLVPGSCLTCVAVAQWYTEFWCTVRMCCSSRLGPTVQPTCGRERRKKVLNLWYLLVFGIIAKGRGWGDKEVLCGGTHLPPGDTEGFPSAPDAHCAVPHPSQAGWQ